jgi:2-oxoglutarate ferredoxin oxidoreductase subunit gamma
MQQEVIIAGFGGQGVLFAGQLLAYAGMDEGKQVTWIPIVWPGNARRHSQLHRCDLR